MVNRQGIDFRCWGRSWARREQPLTEGSLEELCLDGLLMVVLANYCDAVTVEQQPLSLHRGLCDRR